MTLIFKLNEEEITEALKAYIIDKYPQFKDKHFTPATKTKVLSFTISPSNIEKQTKKL